MSKDYTQHALVPRLRFPEFRDAPEWQPTPLSHVLDYERPDRYIVADTDYVESGTPVLTANKSFILGYTNETDGVFENVPVIIFDDFTTDKKFVDFPFKVKSSAIKILKGKRKDQLKLVYELMTGIRFDPTQHKRYYISEYQHLDVPLPKEKEQRKIADCLGSLDDLIAAEGRKLVALRYHKQGLMQQLFPREGEPQPRLRFPEFQDEGEWRVHTLGEVVSISKGKGIAKADIVHGGKTPCIRYAELYTTYGEVVTHVRSHTNAPIDSLVLSEAEDVIIPASGETKHDIATCACVIDAGVALGSDLNVLRSEIDGRFFSYYLNGAKRSELAKVAQGDTVAHLYPSQISQLTIVVPSDENEQHRIADCLSAIDARITAQAGKLDALRTHKRGLMQQLFPSPEYVEA